MTRRIAVLAAVLAATTWGPCERTAVAHQPNVDRWRTTALAVGWTPKQWPWLSCIIARESRGNPNVVNRRDPHGGSLGLTQINRVHTRTLQRAGIIRWPADLLNPRRNLAAALHLWKLYGTRPWRSATRPC